jgi:hypothetical protein
MHGATSTTGLIYYVYIGQEKEFEIDRYDLIDTNVSLWDLMPTISLNRESKNTF